MLVIGAFLFVGTAPAHALEADELTIEEVLLVDDTLHIFVTDSGKIQTFMLNLSDYAEPDEEFVTVQATDGEGRVSNIVQLDNPYYTGNSLLEEAEKYIGYPYVWGGSSPETSFDCSGLVCWAINESGAGSVGRTTAQGLYNLCDPVSPEEVQPGDLVFFHSTYRSADTVTHVGIYSGEEMMLHAGDPIEYVNYVSRFGSLFYGFGRIPN